ncbi:MAG: ABC transporter permease [Anaerolineae bacterium]|nr:ABC transporter permease [Anaerolineae bacterium]
MSAQPPATFVVEINADHPRTLNGRELLQFRELLWTLIWRDIRVRYQQTVIGVLWVFLQPLLLMLIYTLVFSVMVRVPVGDTPYPLFILAGLVNWTFFSQGWTRASQSILNNAPLVLKVYFPRLILPLAAILSNLLDYLLTLGFTLVFAAALGYWPGVRTLGIVACFALMVVQLLGLGAWGAALTARYRDMNLLIPLLLQTLFYLTPVIYPLELAQDALGADLYNLAGLFPMTTVISGMRWAILEGQPPPPWPMLLLSVLSASLLCISGFWYFARSEQSFMDVL